METTTLRLSPPETVKVSDRDFKMAIAAVEDVLGLKDQPRTVIFHEKEGRRHCHGVWSRIRRKTISSCASLTNAARFRRRSAKYGTGTRWVCCSSLDHRHERAWRSIRSYGL